MLANYHTHTPRCGHAQGCEEAYIQEAIKNKLQILGFSDHTPYIFSDTNYISSIRMRPDGLGEYIDTLQQLRKKYAQQIRLHIGVEAEFYPKYFFKTVELLKSHGIEYMILGQHMLGNEIDEFYVGRPFEDKKILERYCDQSIDAMKTGLFTYFAHPDLAYYLPDDSFYQAQMRRLCVCARECKLPMEINFQGIWDHRHYPSDRFWKIAGEEGVQVVFGSDAHQPDRVYVPAAEKAALKITAKYQLPLLETLPLQTL